MNAEKISEYTKCTIHDMSNKVLEHIARKYDSVKEGVQLVMGGKVLEYEAKTIRNEALNEGMEKGRLEGKEEGREEGKEEGIILAARIFQEAKRNPDYTKEEIAAKVGCTVKEVEDTLKMFGM